MNGEESNDEVSEEITFVLRENSMYVPPVKRGWMRKQGRKGLVKSWRKRYFVLSGGQISYYENMLDDPPYGDGLKGTMLLSNTDIIEENKKYNDMQIMLVSYNGDYNMLMEADSPESADAWMASIKEHIRFANRDNEDAVLNPEKAQSRRHKAKSMLMEVSAIQPCSPSASTHGADGVGSGESQQVRQRKYSSASTTSATSHVTFDSAATAEKSCSGADGASSSRLHPHLSRMSSDSEMPRSLDPDRRVSVEEDMCRLRPYLQQQASALAQALADADRRQRLLSAVKDGLAKACVAAMASAKEGEVGKRGEELLAAQIALLLCILLPLHPQLVALVTGLIHISGLVYVLCGLALVLDACVQLGGSFSLFPEPSSSNRLAVGGSYRLVRHPMYGGMVLVCAGLAIRAQRLDKLVLSLFLALLLERVAHKEEALLLQEHPLDYRTFIQSRRKFVPFVF